MWSPKLPPVLICAWLSPLLLALPFATIWACGILKRRGGIRTGDSRKIFHFVVFGLAALLSRTLGFESVNLLGGMVAVLIFALVCLGEGNLLYEALARESDRPRRSLYIILPFASTALGGIVSTSVFGDFATVGFAVTGCADAIAEPIGVRIGRHRYRVPNFGGNVVSERSLEGSAAVFLASILTAVPVLWWVRSSAAQGIDLMPPVLAHSLIIAVVVTIVEAFSHHGLDNFTLQVTASGVAWGLS